jgi:hypothetical protein
MTEHAASTGHPYWALAAFVLLLVVMVVGGYLATQSTRPENRS